MRVTLNRVNNALAARGYKERLVRGRGYFYFINGDAWRWSGVYVYHLNDLSLDGWLEEHSYRRKHWR